MTDSERIDALERYIKADPLVIYYGGELPGGRGLSGLSLLSGGSSLRTALDGLVDSFQRQDAALAAFAARGLRAPAGMIQEVADRQPAGSHTSSGVSGVISNGWLDDLDALEKAAAPNWEFRPGLDRDGDSCDLLMAELLIEGKPATAGEDPEYAEVLFATELGEAQLAANWALLPALRNAAPRLIAIARAAEALLVEVDASSLAKRDPAVLIIAAALRAALADGGGE